MQIPVLQETGNLHQEQGLASGPRRCYFDLHANYNFSTRCHSWFRTSESALPKPLKSPSISDLRSDFSFSEQSESSSYSNISLQDRRTYKNVSIYITELPPTPKRFRDKYHRTREPQPSRTLQKPPCPHPNRIYGRPQTYQMAYVERSFALSRPQTIGFIDTESIAPRMGRRRGDTSASDKISQQWIADINQYEAALEEMADAILDRDFKDELSAIEQWHRVLSEAERAATLYALFQQMSHVQIRFFVTVLQQMGNNHPVYRFPAAPASKDTRDSTYPQSKLCSQMLRRLSP